MAYIIRPSGASDTDILGCVHAQAWQETYPGLMPPDILQKLGSVEARTEVRREIFASTTPLFGHFLVETDTKKVVGFGDCGPSCEVKQFAHAEIRTLYILREAQGNGMGKKLLLRMLAHLASKNFNTAALMTNAKSKTSNGFYQHCGGKIAGQIDREYWSNTVYVWTNLQRHLL